MQAVYRRSSEPALVGVLVYEGVEPIDIGGTVGVVSMASRVLPLIEAVVIAREAGPVRLASGLVVMATHGIDAAPACDVVIVCGGPGWVQAAKDSALLGYLRKLRPEAVASVCTGAMILAAAGLLHGRLATTRRHTVGKEAAAPLTLLSLNGSIRTTVAQVVDSGVVTGGGVSLAIDTTLYLLQRIYGRDVADTIARVIEYDRAWNANQQALGFQRDDI